MDSLTVILFGTECFLFVYIYKDLLKIKTYKLFENSNADLSWLLFSKKPTCRKTNAMNRGVYMLFTFNQLAAALPITRRHNFRLVQIEPNCRHILKRI